ncbi:hypothetical protein DNTS_030063 [Danionella cerebrum]|nr:hypothetical protein DNTS_030063 [Danionella translucida]
MSDMSISRSSSEVPIEAEEPDLEEEKTFKENIERILEVRQRNINKRKSDSASSSSIYIKIPISTLFGPESTSEMVASNPTAAYKLIDGFPSEKDVRKRKSYVMSFDERTRNAEWVYEILNRDTLASMNALPVQFGNSLQWQGYDRGHLAAAANHKWCQEAYNDTFMFSNVSPQLRDLNNRLWKSLEYFCRSKAKEPNVRNVHVYTGPLYKRKEKPTGNAENKTVPSHFFKVIIVEKDDGTLLEPYSIVLPNEIEELKLSSKLCNKLGVEVFTRPEYKELVKAMVKNIEEIESLSGLKFVHRESLKNMEDLDAQKKRKRKIWATGLTDLLLEEPVALYWKPPPSLEHAVKLPVK